MAQFINQCVLLKQQKADLTGTHQPSLSLRQTLGVNSSKTRDVTDTGTERDIYVCMEVTYSTVLCVLSRPGGG